MGKKSKVKGYRGEHEVEKLLRERGLDAVRVPLSGSTKFRKGDVVVKLDEKEYTIEAKRRKKGFETLYKWLENADLVFCRRDRKRWLVVMDAKVFLEIVRKCTHK
jgi:Holliday junction resolvase